MERKKEWSPLKQAGSLAREQKGSLTSCGEQSTGLGARQQLWEEVGEREGRMATAEEQQNTQEEGGQGRSWLTSVPGMAFK